MSMRRNGNGNNKNEEITMDKIKELFESMFKKHEENRTQIVAANLKIINDQLENMDKKINDFQYSLEFTEKEIKQEIVTIKENQKTESSQLKEKICEMEDRSRRNNIRVEGVAESENENWATTKEKL